MKRLISMFLTILFTILNNVEYKVSGPVEFTPDSYYVLEGSEAPDYRELYENYSSQTTAANCVNKSVRLKGTKTVHFDDVDGLYSTWLDYYVDEEAEGMEYLNRDYVTSHCDGDTYTFTQQSRIVAPCNVIVKTKSTSGGGHSMTCVSTDGRFTFQFNGMERWYCCRNRPDLENPEDKWIHTVNIEGAKVDEGYLIGNAVEGTTVTIKDSQREESSWENFYGR